MSTDNSRASCPTEDSKSFTPINSPKGQELDAVMKMKQEEQDEDASTSPLKTLNAKEPKSATVKQTATRPTKGTGSEKSTPSKRGRKTDTATPTKRAKKDNGNATPRKASLPPVPASLAEAGTEDKMILNLRDGEGKSWAEITKLFISVTGIEVGSTTLRLRYGSMKAKFVEIPEEDASRLLHLKKEIEDKFESEKWARISEAIVTDGGGKYPVAALQKKFKQLDKAGVTAASVNASGTAADEGNVDGEGADGGDGDEAEE
ncbi:hypothetical protein BJY01DRAFT_246813 [Aspergillus pseudoustus]|uniref:Uncharacterized protein n=1 Tax=Aspergillus pseudoustus TaxID=1810923 RepID=A0ABR4K571_9EURO